MATSPLPSQGPKKGWNCYVTSAFSGVPNAKRGEIIRIGDLSRALSRAQKRENCYVTTTLLGVPNAMRGKKIRSGYLNPVFLGA